MIERGDRFRFRAKTLHHSGRGSLLQQNHFHGNLPLRTELHRAIDDAHSAAADLFDQIVMKLCAGAAFFLDEIRAEQANRAEPPERGVAERGAASFTTA